MKSRVSPIVKEMDFQTFRELFPDIAAHPDCKPCDLVRVTITGKKLIVDFFSFSRNS